MANIETIWILTFIVGVIAGAFLRPFFLALAAAGLFPLCVAGMLLSSALGAERWTSAFGLSAVAAPAVALMAFAAAMTVHAVLRVIGLKKPVQRDGGVHGGW